VRLLLDLVGDADDLVVLRGRESLPAAVVSLRYPTRTGAIVRLDGVVCGAFDAEHETVVLAPRERDAELTLEVERRGYPTSGLPAGDGFRFRLLRRLAVQEPARTIEARTMLLVAPAPSADRAARLPLIGHAHLDVAWLWPYAQTRRKALRTFATAVRLLEADAAFVFTQSQPQLYAWVAEDDPALFARVRTLAASGRFDASGAALWVESDCMLPSGESLLRQLVHGIGYARETLGVEPSVAWLPDSFGFARTLPTLLAHAGIRRFATTKLTWNDTTTFPHPRFVWTGPDGSRVVSALLAAYVGDASPGRVATARARKEPLVLGYGDGGGGVTDAMLVRAASLGVWTSVAGWFAEIEAEATALPLWDDELYLEYHRGVATTRHDVKACNAALERALRVAEETAAWAVAMRGAPPLLATLRARLHAAWRIVLRAQFHDVLPGTSVAEVYADAHADYDRADALVASVVRDASAVLPRAGYAAARVAFASPRAEGADLVLAHESLTCRIDASGAIVELRTADGPNRVVRANVLAAYVDRPRRYSAWNLDRGYRRRPVRVRVEDVRADADGVEIRYLVGRGSPATARIALRRGEPFVRVALAVDWRERETILRCENVLAFAGVRATFGAPHGAVERPIAPRTPRERAKYEAPGQRYGRVADRDGGLALLALETYGWSLERDEAGNARLGHSLLRAPTWPDPGADRGEQRLAYAFAPLADDATGALEARWEQFAFAPGEDDPHPVPRVPFAVADDPAIAICAVKPADDGDGIVVRIRECDGAAREARVRCAFHARAVACVDALERPTAGEVAYADGVIVAPLGPYGLRSFRLHA